MTGRSSSFTHSRPSTLGCDMASVNGSSSPCWIRYRIVRTGSCLAQPRSDAGAGTTVPRSGHVWGLGVSQCQARLTRLTSSTRLPTAPASWLTPRSPEYQGLAVIRSLDVAEHDRRHAQVSDAGVPADRLLGHLQGVLEGGSGLEAEAV